MKILQRSSSLLLFEIIVSLAILSLFNNNYILATALSSLKYDTSIIEEKQEEPSIATKNFTLLAQERIIQISPDNELHPGGIFYKAMTFNGSIPVPAISVNQGDAFEITLEIL